jgi:hypothetical protein
MHGFRQNRSEIFFSHNFLPLFFCLRGNIGYDLMVFKVEQSEAKVIYILGI